MSVNLFPVCVLYILRVFYHEFTKALFLIVLEINGAHKLNSPKLAKNI